MNSTGFKLAFISINLAEQFLKQIPLPPFLSVFLLLSRSMSRKKRIEKYSRETKNGLLFCTIDLLYTSTTSKYFYWSFISSKKRLLSFQKFFRILDFLKVLHIVIRYHLRIFHQLPNKMPISGIQSQCSMSKIIGIFSNFFH